MHRFPLQNNAKLYIYLNLHPQEMFRKERRTKQISGTLNPLPGVRKHKEKSLGILTKQGLETVSLNKSCIITADVSMALYWMERILIECKLRFLSPMYFNIYFFCMIRH